MTLQLLHNLNLYILTVKKIICLAMTVYKILPDHGRRDRLSGFCFNSLGIKKYFFFHRTPVIRCHVYKLHLTFYISDNFFLLIKVTFSNNHNLCDKHRHCHVINTKCCYTFVYKWLYFVFDATTRMQNKRRSSFCALWIN